MDSNELKKVWGPITLGCWQLAPSNGWGGQISEHQAREIIHAALEGGVTCFDTAEGYGDGESERRLGRALGKEKVRP